jgi:hypothetical protein
MKVFFILLTLSLIIIFFGCSKKDAGSKKSSGENVKFIEDNTSKNVIKILIEKFGEPNRFRIEKGVSQTASLWREEDGNAKEFEKFCIDNFIAEPEKLDKMFDRIQTNFEILSGHFTKMNVDLNKPLQLDIGEILPIDQLFGAYSPSSHLADDFYKNKIAFIITLNFPTYTLKEKIAKGENWTRKEWAYARTGDLFTSRIPPELIQKVSDVQTEVGLYIDEYNIYMGNLLDNNKNVLFPKDLKLITHWGLRDELKTHFGKEGGLEKQKIIYEVMKRIITQEIPKDVINNPNMQWNPFTNKLFKDGKETAFKPEPNIRYQHLLNNFNALKAIDSYTPVYPTYIQRKFDQEFEIPQEEIEKMFIDFISSPIVKETGKLIQQRLGRKLEPFDIWYDGFKARSSINQEELNKATKKKYPNRDAVQNDLPNILKKLGFSPDEATYITTKVEVDPSRGAGHAIGAEMKSEKARLRTRIGNDGMDYKGYNIAVHEFGHNVEQTLTLQKMDYYMLHGVPNTAFTEAWAFVFQARDLELLGIKENNPNKKHLDALDNLWMAYEIMGVSLVDMDVWKWLYKNPNATPEQLKAAVIEISKDIWNKYYADIFGVKDQPILAIYSHMIDFPLYLSAYPLGHLIEFQMEQYITGKNLGTEMTRICETGRIIPDLWMKKAVGTGISIQPLLNSAKEALLYIK